MTNDTDDEQQIVRELSRAQRAREVLDNPLYQEAFAGLRDQLRQEWEISPARDTEGRERLWLAINLLGKVEQHLNQAVQTGRMARMELEQKRSKLAEMAQWAARKWA